MKIMFFMRFSSARIPLLTTTENLALPQFWLVKTNVLFQVKSLIAASFSRVSYFEEPGPNLQSPSGNVIELSFKIYWSG
jgi:hypothetical protein